MATPKRSFFWQSPGRLGILGWPPSPELPIKAKEVASAVNQIVMDEKFQDTWGAIFERMKTGATDEGLHASAHALEVAIEAHIAPVATNYLEFLNEHSPPKLALWVGFLTLHWPKGWTR